MVKFTKKQVQALAQIKVKANAFFDDDLKTTSCYKEDDRSRMVAVYTTAILECVIRDGVIYGV